MPETPDERKRWSRRAATEAAKLVSAIALFATLMMVIAWLGSGSGSLRDLAERLAFSLIFLPVIAFPVALMFVAEKTRRP
jgi:hypothetical protein